MLFVCIEIMLKFTDIEHVTCLNNAIKIYQQILDYAKEVGTTQKDFPNVCTSNCISGKYYLTETQLDHVYYNILLKSIEISFDNNSLASTVTKKRDTLRLPKANEDILAAMQEFQQKKIVVGERSESAVCENALKEAFTQEPLFLSTVVAETIKDLVFNAMTVGHLVDNEFEMAAATLSTHLGKGILTAYLYKSDDFAGLFGHIKNELKVNLLEEKHQLWNECYAYVKDNIVNMEEIFGNKEHQWNLRMILKKHKTYSQSLRNPILLKLIILKILHLGLVQASQEGIHTVISGYLNKLGVKKHVIFEQSLLISEYINEIFSISGAVLLEFLNEQKIFRVYKKRERHHKHTRMAQLKSSILMSLQLSTSYFYPFLTESNRNLFINFSFDQETIRYKASNVEEQIHNKDSNMGVLNENCIFVTHPESASTTYSTDIYFLIDYLSNFGKIANKRIQDVSDEEKELIYQFISTLYCINFNKMPKDELSFELINHALNFNSITDVILYNKIKELKDKGLRNQLIRIYQGIEGNKRSFIGTISQAIIYSAFENFLVPSYFDYRGRKYTVGVHLNMQSYLYTRAFVKPYETLSEMENESILFDVVQKNLENPADFISRRHSLIENWEFESENMIEEYFYSLLKDITFKDFQTLYRNENTLNFNYWFAFVSKHIKSLRKAIMLTSYILPPYIYRGGVPEFNPIFQFYVIKGG
jgi:hypothetical protein